MTVLTIRDMRLEDCEELSKIDRETFSLPLTRRGFEREYSNPNATTLVALYGDELIGYANLWSVCGEVTLNNIAVREKYRSNGAGTALLNEAIRRFSGCDLLTLEVRRSNLKAIKIYERFGFVKVGERRDFYDRPCEDAILMTKFFGEQQP